MKMRKIIIRRTDPTKLTMEPDMDTSRPMICPVHAVQSTLPFENVKGGLESALRKIDKHVVQLDKPVGILGVLSNEGTYTPLHEQSNEEDHPRKEYDNHHNGNRTWKVPSIQRRNHGGQDDRQHRARTRGMSIPAASFSTVPRRTRGYESQSGRLQFIYFMLSGYHFYLATGKGGKHPMVIPGNNGPLSHFPSGGPVRAEPG